MARDMATVEFMRRLGKATSRWGWGESVGCVWGALLVSGTMTQDQLVKVSGFSVALVSSSLSWLEERGFVTSAGKQGRKRLYVPLMSFVGALESFLRRFVDVDVTPAVEVLSGRIHEIKDAEQRLNAERIIEEYQKGRAFIDTLLSLMKKHKDLRLEELMLALPC